MRGFPVPRGSTWRFVRPLRHEMWIRTEIAHNNKGGEKAIADRWDDSLATAPTKAITDRDADNDDGDGEDENDESKASQLGRW